MCVFGNHTFVPIRWKCKKQTCVSHSSTESEIISLDAGLRMDGIPAIDLWELLFDSMHSNPYQKQKDKQAQSNPLQGTASEKRVNSLGNTPDCIIQSRFCSSSVNSSHRGAVLYIFEDNEAAINMIVKGRSPTLRHVSQDPPSCS